MQMFAKIGLEQKSDANIVNLSSAVAEYIVLFGSDRCGKLQAMTLACEPASRRGGEGSEQSLRNYVRVLEGRSG